MRDDDSNTFLMRVTDAVFFRICPCVHSPPALEDDGVVVSTVLDGDARESYLLVLDAQTMLPLAEVRLDGARGMVVPFAIHGDWFAA